MDFVAMLVSITVCRALRDAIAVCNDAVLHNMPKRQTVQQFRTTRGKLMLTIENTRLFGKFIGIIGSADDTLSDVDKQQRLNPTFMPHVKLMRERPGGHLLG
jgi:hypothetical protein